MKGGSVKELKVIEEEKIIIKDKITIYQLFLKK